MANDYAVDIESKFKLGCTPLIGTQIDIDILEFLSKTNALGVMLNRVRKEVEAGVKVGPIVVKGEIKIGFTVKGEIAGGLEASKELSAAWKGAGTISGTIGLGLEAKIGAEVVAKTRWVEVKFGAGGKLELKGAERNLGEEQGSKTCDVGGEVKLVIAKAGASRHGIQMEGAIKFNGAALYFVAYYEVAVKKAESKLDQDKKRGNRDNIDDDGSRNILENKNKYEGVVVLCEPWSWPPQKDEGPLTPAKPGVKPPPSITPLHTALA